MKRRNIISILFAVAAASGATTGVDAACPFCINGITVDEDTPLELAGSTCGSLYENAADYEETEYYCTLALEQAAPVCCPEEAVAVAGGEEAAGPDDGGAAAGPPPAAAADGETEQERPPPEEEDDGPDAEGGSEEGSIGCPVCVDGLTVDPSTPVGGNGRTCATLIEDAAAVDPDDRQCDAMKGAERRCCPDGEVVDGAEGEGAPDDAVEQQEEEPTAGTNVTMQEGDVAEEEEDADALDQGPPGQQQQPEGGEGGCPVCVDGLTVDASTSLGGGGRTCATLIEDAKNVDPDDRECTAMKGAQATCCPSPADDPCLFCAGGLEVDEDADVGRGSTCGSLQKEALQFEAGSDVCGDMRGAEASCCPDGVAAGPNATDDGGASMCYVCPGGLTVDEDTQIGRGATCGSLRKEAENFEETSDECVEMKGAEALCCPGAEDTEIVDEDEDAPCSFCPDGLAPEVDTLEDSDGVGVACRQMVVDAEDLLESDQLCVDMKEGESLCCPSSDTGADDPELNAQDTNSTDESPCYICPDGLAVEDTFPLQGGIATCGQLLGEGLQVQASSVACKMMKASEAECCPPSSPEDDGDDGEMSSPTPTSPPTQVLQSGSPVAMEGGVDWGGVQSAKPTKTTTWPTPVPPQPTPAPEKDKDEEEAAAPDEEEDDEKKDNTLSPMANEDAPAPTDLPSPSPVGAGRGNDASGAKEEVASPVASSGSASSLGW